MWGSWQRAPHYTPPMCPHHLDTPIPPGPALQAPGVETTSLPVGAEGLRRGQQREVQPEPGHRNTDAGQPCPVCLASCWHRSLGCTECALSTREPRLDPGHLQRPCPCTLKRPGDCADTDPPTGVWTWQRHWQRVTEAQTVPAGTDKTQAETQSHFKTTINFLCSLDNSFN